MGLLELGLIPEVSASTSALMVLFIAASSSTQYTLLGMVDWNYAMILCVVSIAGSILGVTVVKWVVQKFNRVSIIIFVLATIISISSVLLPSFALWKASAILHGGNI